jgi:nucleoside-diphosphate-sugar epimerase
VNAPVLVTGATGFVGSHLAERLLQTGVEIRCIARRSSSLRYLPGSGVDLHYADLAAGTGLEEAVEGVRTVFHVAGVTKALLPGEYYEGNVTATENLLRACERLGAAGLRFVHVSSLAATGPSPDGVPLDEDAEPHPLTDYGRSKLAAENAVRSSGLAQNAVIVRPPVVYGPRDTDVFQVFRSVCRGLMVRIGREEALFSYVYVKDLAEALAAAAESPCAGGKTYFAANPDPVTWTHFGITAAAIMGRRVRDIALPPAVALAAGRLAELASKFRGKPGIVSRDKVREALCRYWVCGTSRARRDLGFSPVRSLRDGMEETLAWYKNSGWLKF